MKENNEQASDFNIEKIEKKAIKATIRQRSNKA